MKIAVYGGSFNPPHLGHAAAARTVAEALRPDKFLIIPDHLPPHKEMVEDSPTPEQRMELCALAFAAIPGAEISDMEIRREGKCYNAHTVGWLRELVPVEVLWVYYSAQPELSWLREKAYAWLKPKRIAHVAGCESEAVKLAMRWGEDPETAAEAGILHDITKKLNFEEQLILCGKYGIINDNLELGSPKLLHAKTGAALARDLFGVSDRVYNAIRWHTTGKPDMTLLEKIIYLADYIEPTRDFPGVEKLRELCYEDIDAAMALGRSMSLAHIRSYGEEPYKDTGEACEWYGRGTG